MPEVTLNPHMFDKVIDKALEGTVIFLEDKIKKLAPRSDLQQPVQHPEVPTTGRLEESIHHRKNTNKEYSYRIGTPTSVTYAEYQEYGTRYIPPRSFLRRGLLDYSTEVERYFEKLLYHYSK